MTIDYVASIGNFAFRYVTHSDPVSIIQLMDEEEIDFALVSSLESIMYRNVQKGNELLAERISKHRDRLIPAAVTNPIYPEAIEDTLYCLEDLGMKAIRLYPNYHGYDLTDSRVASVVSVAQEKAVPVSIAFRAEDERQRHWLVNPPPVSADTVLSIIKAFPEVHFVMERASHGELNRLIRSAPEIENWSAETSGRFLSDLRQILDAIGSDRVILGTDMPLQYSKVAILKLESLGLDRVSREKIMMRNASRLLKL